MVKIAFPARPLYTRSVMDGFPFDLVFAVATASATIFLGILPTRRIRSNFFARESIKAAFAWVLVMCASPPAIMHFPFFFALLCGGSWWKFSHDSALSGKMWLSVASGLGISLGIVLILAVTPRAYPSDLPLIPQTLLLASIYLGGAVIGLAYASSRIDLTIGTNSGATHAMVRRYVGLLGALVIARATVLLGLFLVTPDMPEHVRFTEYELPTTETHLGNGLTVFTFSRDQAVGISSETLLLLGLVVIVIPSLAFLAWRATRFSSRIQPTRFLVAICFLGILAETLARLLVL
jgi:hypothetical protein